MKTNEDLALEREFELALSRLVNKTCWSHIAGIGAGTHVALDFGKKVKKAHPTNNKHLTEEQRLYEGEYHFLILCVWRIDSITKVIAGAFETYEEETGTALKGLDKLIGAKVVSINVQEPANDLDICFDNGLTIRLFCDSTNDDEDYDNWMLFAKKNIYVVGNKGKLHRGT